MMTSAQGHAEPRSVRYYHRTDHAEDILRGGFRNGLGSYGLATTMLHGVFVSDVPLDINEGAAGLDLLAVDLPCRLDLGDYELVEKHKPYREWCAPADLLNEHGQLSLLTQEQIDELDR